MIEMGTGGLRKIIHIDMDAFFASIEQRDRPEWRGRPLVVGYPRARSVIAAASYEARQYGVRSAMPSTTAIRLCSDLIFAPPRFDAYERVSAEIMSIFHEYTDLVEPLSLDEAYLDVTANHRGIATATEIATEIKRAIYERTGLTASAGVSYNKFLAKVASDYDKPNGLFVIKPHEGAEFAGRLPVDRFWGVGKATLRRMHELGFLTGQDLRQAGAERLITLFGRWGLSLFHNACGQDDRPVIPQHYRQTIGVETTLNTDVSDLDSLHSILDDLIERLWRRVHKPGRNFSGHIVVLKIKYADFTIRSRTQTHSTPVEDIETLRLSARALLGRLDTTRPIRLVGLSLKRSREPKPEPQWIQPRFPF